MNSEIAVLLVDDEPAVADLAATHLERLRDGFDVTVAEGGEAALTRFERDPAVFDCIVSDYTMADMNGLDLLAAVREIDADRPFVLFTGKGSEAIASEAVSAGVTDYLQKGTGTEQYELLANRIGNAVEAYRAERRADELARINGVISDVQRELVHESTREAIEEQVCACLALSTPYTLAWIGEPDDGGRIVARERAGSGTGYLDEITIRADDTPRGRGPAGRALRSGTVQIVRNIAADETFELWAATADRYDHASIAALPLSYDGSEYGVLVVYSSRRDAFGDEERTALAELAGTVGQAIHATETRAELERRERDLREERAVAEGIFDALPDAIYAFDRDGRMRRWNDAFATTVGYDDGAIAGMNALEFVPETDRDLIGERIAAVTERGETVTVESAFVTSDGETIPQEFNGAPLTDGESVYGVIGSGRDITGRKRREAAITALHESTRDLVRADDRAGVATATIEAAAEVLGFSVTAVRLHDTDTDTLEPVAVADTTRRVLGERPSYARGEALPWRALESGEPVVTGGNVAEHGANDLPLESAMYVPLGDHGTLSIGLPDGRFDDIDIRLAQVLAANAAVALDRIAREAQLRRHERMLDAAGDGIYALDADGRVTNVNDTVVEKTGYAREELLGEHVSMFLEERDVEHGESLIQNLLSQDSGGVSDSFEATVYPTDGSPFPCEIQIALLPTTETEGFQGTVGVIRDITERKARERAIETLHEATREMIDATDRDEIAAIAVRTVERVLDMPMSGIWLHDAADAALRPAAISERGAELFGTAPTYTGGESLSWQAFTNGETRRYDRVDHETNVYNRETPLRSEIVVPLGEFGVLNIGSTESAAFDDDDVSLAKLLATNTEAALSRADRERRLVAEHDRLAALFENVPDAALRYDLVDGEPIVRDVNTAFEEVFGYAAETVAGENIDEFIVPPERDDKADDLNERLVAGERLRTTARRQTADGVRDFLLYVVPIELDEQNAEGYSIYTDITDQQRRQRELGRQNELLEEFASVISHDLRNPLSVARGRLELARKEHDSEHHEDIDAALVRMNDLIEDVLTLARQGRVIGTTERVSLAAVAERAWRAAGTETAALTVDDPGEVEADPDRLARLIENLFRNSVEHGSTNPRSHAREDAVEHGSTSPPSQAQEDATEHADSTVTVTVGALDDGGFFVADDGPGIPDSERERVFEGGYTTGDDSTGLGLSIVRSIAEAHDWTVTAVESESGGARFEIRTQTTEETRA